MSDQFNKFRFYARLLALSNFLQVGIVIYILTQARTLIELTRYKVILTIIILPLLMIDLVFTVNFLRYFAQVLHREIRTFLFTIYIVISALARLRTILSLFEIITQQQLAFTFALSGVTFGMILLRLTSSLEFVHRDKLQLLAYLNLAGLTVIFGGTFQLIYLGVKIFLPLLASFIYLILSFEFDMNITQIDDLQPNLEDHTAISDGELSENNQYH